MKAFKIFQLAILLFLAITVITTIIVVVGYCFWALVGENAIIWLFGIVFFAACLFSAYLFIES